MILRAHNVIRIAFIAFTPIALVACGGGGSSSPPPPPVSVGGTVTRLDNGPIGGSVYGLAGREFELLLQEFGGISYAHTPIFYTVETLGIDRNGHFDFATPYSSGANYVHIGRQPDTPAQRCVVRNEPVTVIANKVTEVEVVCGEFLYVSNAADNTVSAFTVDATTGAIVLAGPPVPAGVSPIAMAGTSDKRYLYVVDSNSDDVSAYFVDPATGALTPIPGAPYPAGKNPRAIVLYRDSYLYVVNSGTNDISAYQIDQSTGVVRISLHRRHRRNWRHFSSADS